ncbi:PREDICTED: rho GTPase-activating protein 29-like [Amphimedon queenslandica]|uniref:Uncharacterized protein n=1 Tax=Amphimedon queenslandica TaxID=400682 RepID=A0A1X7V546_AMPQE|nr:PREDICTED: rho GTPase-activating protein 29-like [Amphimedon queenslandica]|eukprot:XP_011403146.1 PREDICTED: rho GTPase-activating protein 29-like [Amphimedon queenslandica]
MACTVTQLPSAIPLDVNGDSLYKTMNADFEDGVGSEATPSSSRSSSPPEVITTCEHDQLLTVDDDDMLSDDGPFFENWNPCLYSLQLKAPKSLPLPTESSITETEFPEQLHHYGPGYHGLISKADAVELLFDKPCGTFLLRKTMSDKVFLSFNYNSRTYHYSVSYNDNGSLTYDDKDYGSIQELLNNSLILLYVEDNENIDQKLAQGQQQQQSSTQSSNWKRRRHAQYKRRGNGRGRRGPESQSSVDSASFDSTDGLSSVPSLGSLAEDPPTIDVHVSNLDHGQRGGLTRDKGTRQNGSTKSERLTSTTANLLGLPRSGSANSKNKSDSKSRSTGDLTGLLATLVQATVATEGISISRRNSSSYEKPHNFSLTTYRRATWCDLCHHFMWGLVHQGMSCQDCGINIHKQCHEAALSHSDCIPSRKLIRKVFGIDLTTLVMVEGGSIPLIVQQSVAFIERHSLDSEGIYRLSGATSKVLDLKEKFNEGEPVHWNELNDCHIVTGSVKLYFRELPNPLITYDVYPLVIQAVKDFKDDDESFNSNVRQILHKELPRSHYETLQFFVQHLNLVAKHSDMNKMKSHNLAVVFAPTLMKPVDEDGMNLASIQFQQAFIKKLIENFDDIFR